MERRVKPCTSMTTIKTTLTNRQHPHQINNSKLKKLGIDDAKRSLPIWIYGLLWTISRTTVTIQRRLLQLSNRRRHPQDKFIDVCSQHYSLDPAHNYTSPYLLWKAALTMTDVELDLLTEIDQYHFIMERIKAGWQWSATNKFKQSPLAWKITRLPTAIAI